MTNAATLREQAARLRDHAREYDHEAARPLTMRAMALEWEAALLERAGRERRLPRLSLRQRKMAPPRRPFGRAGTSAQR